MASPGPAPGAGRAGPGVGGGAAFPSGHAQGGATLWGYLAWALGSRPFLGRDRGAHRPDRSRMLFGCALPGTCWGYALAFALVVAAAALERWGVVRGAPAGPSVRLRRSRRRWRSIPCTIGHVRADAGAALGGGGQRRLRPGALALRSPRRRPLRQAAKMVLGLAGIGRALPAPSSPSRRLSGVFGLCSDGRVGHRPGPVAFHPLGLAGQ